MPVPAPSLGSHVAFDPGSKACCCAPSSPQCLEDICGKRDRFASREQGVELVRERRWRHRTEHSGVPLTVELETKDGEVDPRRTIEQLLETLIHLACGLLRGETRGAFVALWLGFG